MSKTNKTKLILNIELIIIIVVIVTSFTKLAQAAGICGTGTWIPGNLEIHHIDIGQGDSALIVGPTGKSLLLDVGEENYNSSAKAQIIGPYIEAVLGCKTLDYVLISHFHLDHIGYVGYGGLWNLVESQGFTVGTTLVRDYSTYLGDTSGTFTNWKAYLEGVGQSTLHPVTATEGSSQVDLGAGVTFDIVALDGNGALIVGNFSGDTSPPSENDYSIGAVLSYGNFDEWLGGDLDGEYQTGGFGYTYHDIELSTAPEVGDVDVYKANHHGSSHSGSATFINQLDPEVSIISLGDGNSYGHPAQTTMDRLLPTSTVYLTQRGELTTNVGAAIVAGNIVIKTSDGTNYTVNGTTYIATEPVRSDIDGEGYFAEADPDDNDSGLVPAPNGGCGPIYQTCSVSCQVSAGQVLINEVFPAPSSGSEWVELYNSTANTINIGYCYIDDIVAGSAAYQIPAGTLIPARGFWTLDRTTYFNNTGDDVRFLKEDFSTVLDTYTYGNTSSNLSWYRLPDGGTWSGSPTAFTTKGQTNTIPFYPIVSAITRTGANPASAANVSYAVTFSKLVTGVNVSDFILTTTGVAGASITGVSGSGNTYSVMVNIGSGNGTIRLDVTDNDSVKDVENNPLGGVGAENGNFTSGEVYSINTLGIFADVPTFYWAWGYIERLYNAGITSGCSVSPLNYCPTTVVTRDQMAIFLLRAKYGNTYVPPVPSGVFQDVPTNYWAAAWIEQLAAEGITSGCSVTPKLYCPSTSVTRDQMAIFLLRAKYGNTYVPPVPSGVFQDVPTNYWAAAWIEQLAAEGITSGCSVTPKLYCPSTSVTRDQMAVFLVRMFNLP